MSERTARAHGPPDARGGPRGHRDGRSDPRDVVAGKTGTAELRSREEPAAEGIPAEPRSKEDTDAWFVAYAPSARGTPRVAVGVMLVGAGAGGETAAPAARGRARDGAPAQPLTPAGARCPR